MSILFVSALGLCLIGLWLTSLRPVSKRHLGWLFLLTTLVLAGLGASIVPKPIYDLYRHYEIIDRLRNSGYSFTDYVLHGYKITDANYQYTYIYNALVYVIARLFPNQMLPFITILITYGVYFYIQCKELEEEKATGRFVFVSFCVFTLLMPFLFVYSNIRNALAAAIMAFGIYRFLKFQRKWNLIVTVILAVLIHPVSIAVLPFVFLSKYRPGLKGMVIAVAFPIALTGIMDYLRLHSSGFLFRIAAKYYNYTNVREDNQGRFFLYSVVLMLLILVFLALWTKKRNPSVFGGETKMPSLLFLSVWFSLFALGYVRNYMLIMRLPYSIAFFSPAVSNELFMNNGDNARNRVYASFSAEIIIVIVAALGVVNNVLWLM